MYKNDELRSENNNSRAEIDRLNLELKKCSRELRLSKSFLDKVIKTSEAKDALSNALSEANIKQRAYVDILLECCPSIIILFNDDGRFVLSTNALLVATNIPNFDFLKNSSYEEVFPRYFTGASMEKFRAAVKKLDELDEVVTFDAWVDFSQSGKAKFYSVELRRTGNVAAGTVDVTPGFLAVMDDLTDFMQEKQRAESANNAKSDFLAAMSHEIRTPMNAIIGMSEMLSRTELNERQKKYLLDIRRSSSALLTIINDILDFSKIEAGKMDIVCDNYNLRSLLDNLYSMFTLLCNSKNLNFNFSISKELPEVVRGDENRLRQVLTNLLSNATKYTNTGAVSFSALMMDEKTLRFDIIDTGIGIRKEDTDKLFKPFEQLDSLKNRNILGTGLGLPISNNLCKLMGGNLTLESVYGEGSTFSVSVPYIPAAPAITEEVNNISDFSAPNAKILVVDDIEINLEVAQAMLDAFDITPVLVMNGLEAIKCANNNRFDIIFMDHMMPEMNGLETTKRIRQLGGWNEKAPIIALTANAIEGMDKIYISHQMNDFLFKPLEMSSLNRCLKKWLPPELITEEKLINS